jgi:hypothetical protein
MRGARAAFTWSALAAMYLGSVLQAAAWVPLRPLPREARLRSAHAGVVALARSERLRALGRSEDRWRARLLQSVRRRGSEDWRAGTCLCLRASEASADAGGGTTHAFDVETAVLCAGFAFEAYNEPSPADARWERGADGCDVAFMSDDFARQCYAGRLEVRLRQADQLPPPSKKSGMAQALLSGSQPDAYVLFALNEESEVGPKDGAIGLRLAVDRARSSTVWSRDNKSAKGIVTWQSDECHALYVKDPSRAELSLTVMDEEVLKDDEPLGAASVKLGSLLDFTGSDSQRSWSGYSRLP